MNKQTEQLLRDVRKLEEKYSLSYKEILDEYEKKRELLIPVSIFNDKLGSLECIVKFLKENSGLSIQEISILTNRKAQPVRTTYLRARNKFSGKLKCEGKETIPLAILNDRRFSVLENIVGYLLRANYSINEVSSVLKRDYQTIWTIMQRLKRKT